MHRILKRQFMRQVCKLLATLLVCTVCLVACATQQSDELDLPRPATDINSGVPLVWPLCAEVVSTFGYRTDPFTGRTALHSAIDIGRAEGIAVVAAAAGEVIAAEERGPYGLMIEIDHGGGVRTRYGHLKEMNVVLGQHVASGQRIALTGASGRALSPHLHFELWVGDQQRDPLARLNPEECRAALVK